MWREFSVIPHGKSPTGAKQREADSYTPHGRPPTEVKRREADIGISSAPQEVAHRPTYSNGRGAAMQKPRRRGGRVRHGGGAQRGGSRPPRFFGGGEARPRRGGLPPSGGNRPGLHSRKTPSLGRIRQSSWVVGDRVGWQKARRGRPARGARRTEAAGG